MVRCFFLPEIFKGNKARNIPYNAIWFLNFRIIKSAKCQKGEINIFNIK